MPKYKVYFLTVAAEWEDVEAESEDDAIGKCSIDRWADLNEFHHWIACEQEEEE